MQYRFIHLDEILAAYMIEKQKDFISFKELYIFGRYLEHTLTNQTCKTVVEYGNEAVKDLARKNEGHFSVESQGIACAHNNAYLQEHILTYISVDKLFALIDATQHYSKRSASNLIKDLDKTQEQKPKPKQEQKPQNKERDSV